MKTLLATLVLVILAVSSAAGAEKTAPSLKPVERDGKWGFADPAGKIVIRPQFDYAGGFSEALAPVLTGAGWGYINESGEMVIPPRFAEVDLFAEGLAAVKTGGKWGFIDQTGKMVIPPQAMIQPYSAPLRFTEGLVPVTIGHRYGYMDKTGKVVIPPQFVVTAEWGAPAEFSQGVAEVEIPPTWGYIDQRGKIVIPYQFQEGRPFGNGLAPVAVKGEWGFIDKSAKMVIAPQYDEVEPFSQGLAAVRLGDRYGFIDMTGKLAVPLQFDQTERFSEGLARVKSDKDQKWGFIDRAGKLAIPYSFSNAGDFAEERAWVELDGHGGFIDPAGKVVFTVNKPVYFTSPRFWGGLAPAYSQGKWGYVDKNGKFSIKPRFDFARDFSGPTAVVRLGKRYGLIDRTGKMVAEMKPPAALGESTDGLTQFTPDLGGKNWGFVDFSGKTVIAPRYIVPPVEGGMPPRFSQGLAAVYVKGKYGFIDRQDKLVIAATFDEARSFAEDLAPVATGYRVAVIDKTGKVVKQSH